ncbi:hypothetical protein DRW41_07000 [Neobacillus piezotolerans]|uniref:Uncharacterized protein n=1 Tax=Neobacillus piezotolerans TaxID=2259171 RepID=A0A3D8GTD2_9BACI|nr:hypothetical protein DRW41_07000 [Neobacillus piezotolerans]
MNPLFLHQTLEPSWKYTLLRQGGQLLAYKDGFQIGGSICYQALAFMNRVSEFMNRILIL